MDFLELILVSQYTSSLPCMARFVKDVVKGIISNQSLRLEGIEASQSSERILLDGATNGEWVRKLLNSSPAQVVPPCFK